MNKSELVDAVASGAGVSRGEAEGVLTTFFDTVRSSAKSGDTVSWPGFGKFKTSPRAARTARNPQTGQSVKVKASTAMKFTPSSVLKDFLNTKGTGKKKAPAKASAATKASGGRATTAKATPAKAAAKSTGTGTKASTTKASAARSTATKSAAANGTAAKKAPAKSAPAKKAPATKATTAKAAAKKAPAKRSR